MKPTPHVFQRNGLEDALGQEGCVHCPLPQNNRIHIEAVDDQRSRAILGETNEGDH